MYSRVEDKIEKFHQTLLSCFSHHSQKPLRFLPNSKAIALQLWVTFKESITVYTGLSPTTFFTVTALGLAVYYAISGMFGSSNHHPQSGHRPFEEEMQPLPPPVQLGEITEEELRDYDGTDSRKPLLIAIKGQIYDVSPSSSSPSSPIGACSPFSGWFRLE